MLELHQHIPGMNRNGETISTRIGRLVATPHRREGEGLDMKQPPVESIVVFAIFVNSYSEVFLFCERTIVGAEIAAEPAADAIGPFPMLCRVVNL